MLQDAVQKIAQIVRNAGGRALMVGGAVRDTLSNIPPKDVDIEVFGIEANVLRNLLSQYFELDLVGISFGIIKLHHLEIDISLPRRESKRGLGHKGFEVLSDPNLSIEEAALRRDFTINSIYLDPLSNEILDPYDGLRDLSNKVLRHVSEKFREDPLRVLRGMQFVARFDLTPTPETVTVCRSMTPEGLPSERLFEEWTKLLLKGRSISKGLSFLRETGWVHHYPELSALIGCAQDPEWHPEGDVWNHTLFALDAFAGHRIEDRTEDLIVGLAVLCHDFGKPFVTRFERGHIRSHGHDVAGIEPTSAFLKRLTKDERILSEVPPLVATHMLPFDFWRAKASDNAIRRLAYRVKRIDRLVRVAQADSEGHPPSSSHIQPLGEEFQWLLAAAKRLRIADSRPKPIFQGRHLIELGYTPSPQFGIWISSVFEAQLDGIVTDLPSAFDYFKKNVVPYNSPLSS